MQRSLRVAKPELDSDDFVFVSIANDPNLSNADLIQYADTQGFDWMFAASTPDMIRELANTYGRQVLVTPTMPHFVIRPDGSVSELFIGASSPQQLLQEIQSAVL